MAPAVGTTAITHSALMHRTPPPTKRLPVSVPEVTLTTAAAATAARRSVLIRPARRPGITAATAPRTITTATGTATATRSGLDAEPSRSRGHPRYRAQTIATPQLIATSRAASYHHGRAEGDRASS